MGGIPIAVLPIREEINLETDDDRMMKEDMYTKPIEILDDEEPERLRLDENQITVDESGGSVRAVIALRNDDAYSQPESLLGTEYF